MKLNLACGEKKMTGYINIDMEPSVKPDLVADFTKGLPYENNSIESILLFHAIEHVRKPLHEAVFKEFWRVLQPNGRLVLSYPEFKVCAENWLDNRFGWKTFWENTIFGLQRFPSDYHVCAMNSQELEVMLTEIGFVSPTFSEEPGENWNTVCKCSKGTPQKTYEQVLTQEIFGIK